MEEELAFEILNLPMDASSSEIENRFRELVSQHHPDSGGSARELMELIEARETAIESLPGAELAIYKDKGPPKISDTDFDQKKEQSEKNC